MTTTTATFHYMHDGQFVFADTMPADDLTPQEFADGIASVCILGADEVQVWFGQLDGRQPDAVAEVLR